MSRKKVTQVRLSLESLEDRMLLSSMGMLPLPTDTPPPALTSSSQLPGMTTTGANGQQQIVLNSGATRCNDLEIDMDNFVARTSHRLICQLLWRERSESDQPGSRPTVLELTTAVVSNFRDEKCLILHIRAMMINLAPSRQGPS
jgi:hypothetical protein